MIALLISLTALSISPLRSQLSTEDINPSVIATEDPIYSGFCNERYRDNLVDHVFHWKDIIYAYREADGFWILRYEARDQTFRQLYGPLTKNALFANMRNDFPIDSVLSIWAYKKCAPSGDCRNNNRDFDPTNSTLVFSGDNAYVYRRQSDDRFVEADPSDKMGAWGAKPPFGVITSLLPTIYPPIVAPVLVPPIDTANEYVVLLTRDYLFEFGVKDSPLRDDMRDSVEPFLELSRKNGGLYLKDQVYFFLRNQVYTYPGSSKLTPTGLDYWKFFKCSRVVTTTTVATNTLTEDTIASTEETISSTEETIASTEETIASTEETIASTAETTVNITDTNNEQTIATSVVPTDSQTDTSDQSSDTTGSETTQFSTPDPDEDEQQTGTLSPKSETTTTIVGQPVVGGKTEVRYESIIFLIMVGFLALVTTMCAVYGYLTLAHELV